MTKIAILDRLSLAPSFELQTQDHNVEVNSFDSTSQAQLVAHLEGVELAILSKVAITADDLDQLNHLKHIAVAATGFNIVDVTACEQRGVSVSHIPSYAATTVAEHVLACALTLHRQILDYRQKVIDGAWQEQRSFCLFGKPFRNLRGATLGIVGLGEIGAAVAGLFRPLGVKVIYTSRQTKDHWARQVELDELLKTADIVSLHCSLNETTAGLLGEAELAMMKPEVVLINTARGGLVDEVALAERVKFGQIAGVAFDVLLEEPPKPNSPLLQIADLNSVIITPHSSWTSEQALKHLETELSANVRAYLDGNARNLVTSD